MKVGFHELMPDGRGRIRSGRYGGGFFLANRFGVYLNFYQILQPEPPSQQSQANYNKLEQIRTNRTDSNTISNSDSYKFVMIRTNSDNNSDNFE